MANRDKNQPRYKVPKGKYSIAASDDKLQRRAERFAKKPTTTYGFISRGEDARLQTSEQARYDFFNEIVGTFVEYCQDHTSLKFSGQVEALIGDHGDKKQTADRQTATIDRQTATTTIDRQTTTIDKQTATTTIDRQATTIDTILANLRKLREALLSVPCTDFTVKVYLFSIRIGANIGHYQTYIPSITYLIRQEISNDDRNEIAALLILHTSHFNNDNSLALGQWHRYLAHDTQMKRLVSAWIAKDYYTWVKMYNHETDNGRSTIMKFGLRTMVGHMVVCITKSYFNLSYRDLEAMLPKGISFQSLLEDFGARWQRQPESDNVVIKSRAR